MSRFILAVISASALVGPLSVSAGSIELPSIAPSEVQISNTSTTHAVNFRVVGSNCPRPLDVSLKPDHYGTYSCDGATSFSFSIVTEMGNGSTVSRTAKLWPTRRYEIFVEPAGVWAIREVASR